MAGSLQDQLLSKGLINKNKAKKIEREKNHKKRLSQKHKTELVDGQKAIAKEALKAKAENDRQLNLHQKAKAEEIAIKAQIKQLIETNSVEVESKDIAFIFSYHGKPQTLVVSKFQEIQLNKGRLCIVVLAGDYHLVPNQIAEKIGLRNASFVAYQADLLKLDDGEEDPYADYQIPDDLIW